MDAEARFLKALYEISDFASSLGSSAEEDKVWSRLLDKITVALNAEAASYFTFVPTTGYLLPVHSIGPRSGELKEITIDVKTGIIGWAALHREPVVVLDVGKDPRFLKDVDQITGFETKTVIAIPLLENLTLSGVMEFINRADGPFSEKDFDFVQASCRIVGVAVRHLKLESVVQKVTLRNAAILENLTGGFIAVDLHGRVIILNPAAKRILGLAQDAKLNLPLEQTLPAALDLARVIAETLSRRQAVKRQEIQIDLDGKKRVIGYSTMILQDTRGVMTGAAITFQDITPS